MRTLLANLLARWARWLHPKAIPQSLAGNQWTGSTFVDVFQKHRNPTPNELMAELKSTAWACASINASVCASFPPRLYVATHDRQPPPKCLTKRLDARAERRLRGTSHLPPRITKA